ncbi:MAG: prepilin peptidase [Eubacteriales bacterium]|nr:prepilin peptidase [Eubacteriales bacterium]
MKGGKLIVKVWILVFLGINTWMDVRKKEISLVLAGIFAATGVVYSMQKGAGGWQMLLSMGIGVMFLALSMLTRGAVGMGDGWLIASLGTVLSVKELLYTVCAGMLLAAGYALVLLVIFRRKRDTEIPFVPFLLAGYTGGLLLW